LTIFIAEDQRLTLADVVTIDGAHTTVDIARTFPLHATAEVIAILLV